MYGGLYVGLDIVILIWMISCSVQTVSLLMCFVWPRTVKFVLLIVQETKAHQDSFTEIVIDRFVTRPKILTPEEEALAGFSRSHTHKQVCCAIKIRGRQLLFLLQKIWRIDSALYYICTWLKKDGTRTAVHKAVYFCGALSEPSEQSSGTLTCPRESKISTKLFLNYLRPDIQAGKDVLKWSECLQITVKGLSECCWLKY